ncbi:hypothetical protein V3C99_012344 [Haemonchus contortus]|uniref:CCDC50_N domain-containing protein n=1 Tax=Haemonchus contortus TaxID=6289 RepID=A0A7I5E7F2_HAECO
MEENISVAAVTQRLREMEDHNIALRLQEEEFMRHYNRNREDRRLVADDTKRSIREQMYENEIARQQRLEANKKIAESDEELARRLQREFEEEARRQQEEQAQRDAELARRLALIDQPHTSCSNGGDQHGVVTSNVLEQPLTDSADQPLIDLSTDERPPTMDFLLPGCSTSPPMESTQGATLLKVLHPTNPFLQDIVEKETAQPMPLQQSYHSEFGLPPPSDLALGKRN